MGVYDTVGFPVRGAFGVTHSRSILLPHLFSLAPSWGVVPRPLGGVSALVCLGFGVSRFSLSACPPFSDRVRPCTLVVGRSPTEGSHKQLRSERAPL